jgi:D-glycero-alpha-D-manno-heptose-7-phosphate kinase
VRARACCRVDLAGGTLDIWPLGLLHPGASTVNVAVDLAVEVELERRDAGYVVEQDGTLLTAGSPAELRAHDGGGLVALVAETLALGPTAARLRSASPRGGGLGASSAMAVALLAAGERLNGRDAGPPAALARLARDLEARLMGLPTGLQDHYPALLGGALAIAHRPGGEAVRRLAVDLRALGDSLLVVYTGQSHFSAGNNWQIVRRRLDGDPQTAEIFAGIAEVASAMAPALEAGDLPRAGALLGREWELRRRLAPGISTPTIEDLLRRAGELGAWGGKACGAGGGGCVALLCPPERRGAIAGELAAAATVLPAAPTAAALTVEAEA